MGFRTRVLALSLMAACAPEDDFEGTASGGIGPCSEECEVDADCPDSHACREVVGDACGFECHAVECTSDQHCSDGGLCSLDAEMHEYKCLPSMCRGATAAGTVILENDGAIEALQGLRCVHGKVVGSGLTSLVGLETLVWITRGLFLYDNAELTTVQGLDSLVQVGSLELQGNAQLSDLSGLGALARASSIYIKENASLPAAQIAELLSHVDVALPAQTCGNLDDDPCDPGT